MSTDDNYQFQYINKDVICFHNSTRGNYSTTSFPYHRHDAYEIYLFLGGNTSLYLERACYHLNIGDLIIINPEEMHRSVCLDNELYERIGINIKRSLLERLSSSRTNLLSCFESHPKGQNNLIHLTTEQMNYFVTLADKLSLSLNSSDFGQDILSSTYLSQILVFINTLYKNGGCHHQSIMPELVHNTMAYIEEHLTETITLKDLSDQFSFNGTYISSKFKQHTGLTLRSYILDQRIAFAKSLLREGKNVSEACYMSGFLDYSNFIRSFTNSVGISPGKYKQQLTQ